MTRISHLISFTILLLVSLQIKGQDLEFYREDIVFDIHGDSAYVDALYYFCNVGDKDIRLSLFYPFPEGTRSLIDSIRTEDVVSQSVIPHRDGNSGIFFEISVRPYAQSAYRVFYRQKLEDRHFKYILTSTSTWRRPLDFANYRFQIPQEDSVHCLSIQPDTTFIEDHSRLFLWHRKDFMPEKDFEVFLEGF